MIFSLLDYSIACIGVDTGVIWHVYDRGNVNAQTMLAFIRDEVVCWW